MAISFHASVYPSTATSETVTVGHDGTDGSVKTGSGKLILSSSSNAIHISSSLTFGVVPELAYHVRAVNSHLILSSSAGSVISLSGSLFASGSANAITGTLRIDPNLDLSNANSIYHLRAVNSHLILSSSAGSIISLSGSLFASGSANAVTGTLRVDPNLDLSNANAVYHVRAVNSHLILSSSAGSVVKMSAALAPLRLTTATLIAGSDVLTGAIVWDNTTKTLRTYSAEGWVRILTGTVA